MQQQKAHHLEYGYKTEQNQQLVRSLFSGGNCQKFFPVLKKLSTSVHGAVKLKKSRSMEELPDQRPVRL